MTQRILSIDILRGATVIGMILVNNPGDWRNIYTILKHANWNGLLGADLVFPFFLFTMGFSSFLSLHKKTFSWDVVYKITKRTIVLILLGLFLNWIPDFDLLSLRIPGVLQRIGVVYFFTACIIFLGQKIILPIAMVSMIGYYILLMVVSHPELGYPSISQSNNIPAYIDNLLLSGHLWKYSKTWDPEGILSSLSSVGSSLLGAYSANRYLQSGHSLRELFLLGISFSVFGGLLSIHYPINKTLWTGSYILATTGLALFSMIGIEYMIQKKWTKEGIPFIYFGVNALLAFFLSSLLVKLFSIPILIKGQKIIISQWLFLFYRQNFSPKDASLFWSLSLIVFWTGVFYFLYKKNYTITV